MIFYTERYVQGEKMSCTPIHKTFFSHLASPVIESISRKERKRKKEQAPPAQLNSYTLPTFLFLYILFPLLITNFGVSFRPVFLL
jgi:hypothetical protein